MVEVDLEYMQVEVVKTWKLDNSAKAVYFSIDLNKM